VNSSEQQPVVAVPSEGELFKRTLGAEWRKLHPDIRQRFDKNPLPGERLYYTGTLTELHCSLIGKLLAYLTQPLIGGALIPASDTNFPVDIEVYSKLGNLAIFKQRIYRLNRRKPIKFTSHMLGGEKGEVFEYVGSGLGMVLRLHVQEGNLHFTSDGYFWEIMGYRIPIPGFFTPGKTYLVHRNEGPERFSIRIEIRHCLFGTTFTQAGEFREIKKSIASPRDVGAGDLYINGTTCSQPGK
jgi:hypothetical protein